MNAFDNALTRPKGDPMTLISRLTGWALKLPPAETRDIVVEQDLKVPMPDGAVLLADRYFPRGSEKLPTVLIRTPYGRRGLWPHFYGYPFAERGFQVLIESCRGTFGSGGTFDPFRSEKEDGLATLDWLEAQPWFSGQVVMTGGSYLGIVQWAIAAEAGSRLTALAGQVTTADIPTSMYFGGSFWLETALFWAALVEAQEQGYLQTFLALRGARSRIAKVSTIVPLREMDEALAGKPLKYLRDWLDHPSPDAPFWKPVRSHERLAEVSAPVHLLSGWYDVFTPGTIADYEKLRAAGKNPYLTIGPWAHLDNGWIAVGMRESIVWFQAVLKGDRGALRPSPVRLFVMGADEWREYPSFPPDGIRIERWHLLPDGGLGTRTPEPSEPDRYTYNPEDPTPSVGGTMLGPDAGPKDNQPILGRSDILVYTSPPLERDVEAIGPVSAELFVESSREDTDFFVRLCDTAPSGKTLNVCDGIVRLRAGAPPRDERGRRQVRIELWPTAYRFKKGHRIRVLVASGAHPRFCRNPGSDEPLATATTLLVSNQAVHHSPECPSAILLPISGT